MTQANRRNKVAILTLYFQDSNYGGILQAYALQKVLEDLGYAAEQISYQLNSGYPVRGRKIKLSQVLEKLINRYVMRQMMKARTERDRKILSFAEGIPHTRMVTASTISLLNSDYDAFVCGSDQIWNPIGWQPTLFLDFVQPNKTKIAYAASMAREKLTPSEQEFLRKYIQGFAAVSVRESNSIPLIKNSGVEQHVELMPDPVLLLSADQWKSLAAKREKKKPYLFAYFLGGNKENRESAHSFAKRNGLEMQYIPYLNGKAYGWDMTHKEEKANDVGIPEFLSLIRDAEVVITDSFHGAAFSILFGKRLIVLDRFKKGDADSMNSRLETLFAETKMKLEQHQKIPKTIDEIETPNFTTVEALQEMRTKGLDFLEKYVGKNE